MRRGTKKLTLISLIIFALLGLQACKNKKLLDKNEKNPTVQTFQAQSNGPQTLGTSPYDYTLWYQGGVKHTLSWYGASQRGGAAFKATWSDSDDFLARVGYSWTNAGEDIKNIGNISCQFSYKKSGEGTAGNYNYIGIYGWIRNETATDPNEKLVEYYIVDDWFGNGGQSEKTPITTATTQGNVPGTYQLDGATYQVIKNVREDQPSIYGNQTFTQYFAIRQSPRQKGTISISQHFAQWQKMGLAIGKVTESSFLVESSGESGWLDCTYLKFTKN